MLCYEGQYNRQNRECIGADDADEFDMGCLLWCERALISSNKSDNARPDNSRKKGDVVPKIRAIEYKRKYDLRYCQGQ